MAKQTTEMTTSSVNDSGLWRKTLDVAFLNWKPAATYVGVMMLIELASDYMSNSGVLAVAQIFAAALLAIPAHFAVLMNADGLKCWNASNDNKLFSRFAWNAVGLGAVALLIAFLPALPILLEGGPANLFILAFLLILLLSSTLVFAFWGTTLPATVLAADRGWRAAGIRGRKTFRYAFPRLMLSFGFITVLQLLLIFSISKFSNGDGKFFPSSGGIDVAAILSVLLANIFGVFQVVMTAVILSRAYLSAEEATTI